MSYTRKLMLFFVATSGLAALSLAVRDPGKFWPLFIFVGFAVMNVVLLVRQRRA